MRIQLSLGLLAFVAFVAAGCGTQAGEPPYKPTATIEQIMEGPVAHGAEVYWGSVATIIDKDGVQEKFPKNDEEWATVWAAAVTMAEAGNLLMMPTRAKDDDEWMKFSVQLVDAGMAAAKAAENRDREKVLEEGGNLYTVCTNCHMKYIPQDEGDGPAPVR